MRLKMREKILCFGDDFEVTDERGHRAFYIDGKVFTLRKTLVMKDGEGNEVAIIRKRLLSIGQTWEIEGGGKTLGVVHKKHFTFFRAKFTIDVPGPDDLEASGNFLDHDYVFTRGASEVAWVSKRWFSISDSYGIEVADDRDAALIVASAVVIDLCLHPDEKDED